MATQSKPYSSAPGTPPVRNLSIAGARRRYFSTSVGTKVLVGATGLLLVLYLVLHLAGNLLVVFGPATFNSYAHFLIKNPLIIPLEIGLAAVFLMHVFKTITNWWANRQARPVNYHHAPKRMFGYGWAGPPSRKSIASSTMIFSGLFLFFFVIVHLQQFRFGAEYLVMDGPNPSEVRDLYRLEIEIFSNLFNVAFYVFSMVVVGSHLWHGISSSFNSLGANGQLASPLILRIGRILAVVLTAGFLFIPIWAYLAGGR